MRDFAAERAKAGLLDENAISVPCRIEGCNARVHGDVRCGSHGGSPIYEWRTSAFGETTYSVKTK